MSAPQFPSGPTQFSLEAHTGGRAGPQTHSHDHGGHGHDHGHDHDHDHDHAYHDHGEEAEHVHSESCGHGKEDVHSPWALQPWVEVKQALLMVPMDDVDAPTMVSNCQSIADWEAALLHGTIDLNACDERGYNGLHYAVRRGQLNLVKYLVSRNADLHKPTEDKRGAPLLHLAIDSGDISTLQFLVGKGLPVEGKNNAGETCIHHCVRYSRLVQLTYLLRCNRNAIDIQDGEGRTPIHQAIIYSSFNITRQLLLCKPNVYLYDNTGFLPIHQAVLTANSHALLLLGEYDFKQFTKCSKKGESLITIAMEAGDQTCLTVIRQYASIAAFPTWFKSYMWNISAITWVFIFLVAAHWLNFWITLAVSAFALRTLHNLTQTEYFKMSKNPVMAAATLATSGFMMLGYFFWAFSYASTEHPFLSILVIALYLLSLELYRRVYFRDPGFHTYSAEDTVEFAILSQNESVDSTLCESCLANRPLRTKHCSKCDRCIDDAQHHCVLLNCCVAKNSHAAFLAFLLSTAVTLFVWLYLVIPYILSTAPEDSAVSVFNVYATLRLCLDLNGALTIFIICGLAAFVYSVIMLAYHARLIALNLTAYESTHWNRYPYLQNEQGQFHNPNDAGMSENVRKFIDRALGRSRAETSKTV